MRILAFLERRRFAGAGRAAFTLAALVALTPALVRAEESAEDRATARQLAIEGNAALKNGDYALAADRFRRADELVHAPTLQVDLARALIGLKQLVEAHEVYQRVLREGVSKDALASWTKALQAAEKEDAALSPRLAWVTIQVIGADGPAVQVDGEDLSAAAIGVKRAINPGRRTISAKAEGFLDASHTVELAEGETSTVELVLERDPNYVPPADPNAVTETPGVAVDTQPRNDRTLAYVALGIGGAGLIAGGVTTVLMLQKRSALEDDCVDGRCPPSSDGDLSSYRTYGTVAAIGYGVGLAGIAAGTYLLLSQGGSSEEDDTTVGVYPTFAPGYAGLGGRF